MKVAAKLPALVLGIALLCSAGVGIASYISSANTVKGQAEQRLMALAESRRDSLLELYHGKQRTIEGHVQGKTLRAAYSAFDAAWAKYKDKASATLTKIYVTDNPHPIEERDQLVKAGRKPYDKAHAKHHTPLRDFADANNFPDLLLVNMNGDVIYSARKLADFGVNVQAEAWQNTALADAYKTIVADGNGAVVAYDPEHYPGRDNEATGFLAAPITVGSKTIGMVVYEAPTSEVTTLLGKFAGLGETGETLLLNADGLAMNDSLRTADVSELLSDQFNAPEISASMSGGNTFTRLPDFNGQDVFAAIVPVTAFGQKYAVVVVQAASEVLAPLTTLQIWIFASAIVCALIAGVFGLVTARGLSARISGLSDVMNKLAGGDTKVDVPAQATRDEIAEMAASVRVFRENALERERLEQEQKETSFETARQADAVASLISDFRSEVTEMLDAVYSNSEQMRTAAEELNGVADETAGEASNASSASEAASTNVQTVASASEELSASIQEIRRQVQSTTDIVQSATQAAMQTNTKIEGLAESAQRIGDVVNLISAIAEQTNLLALNATIEAARAGEAGRGFAVVASEVKELATQTAKATEEIEGQITEVQAATKEAVSAIAGITETMSQVDEYTGTIAAAVEQQGAATNEISGNVQDAARGTQDVAQTIITISEKAQVTSSSAGQVLNASTDVNARTTDLRETVDRFLKAVAAA
ncbi:MAG: methyl-accepting chemotaxis protein [Pseudomonadota bacterium]